MSKEQVRRNLQRVNKIVYDFGKQQQEAEELLKQQISTSSPALDKSKIMPNDHTLDFGYDAVSEILGEPFAETEEQLIQFAKEGETKLIHFLDQIKEAEIREISFKHNNLVTLKTPFLTAVSQFSKHLQTLDLSHNDFANIDFLMTLDASVQFPQLKKLVLSYNRIKEMDIVAFIKQRCGASASLEVIDLSNNNMQKLQSTHSEEVSATTTSNSTDGLTLKSLRELRLEGNKFTTEEIKQFFSIMNLKSSSLQLLSLSKNHLKGSFPVAEVFKVLPPTIQEINLEENEIEEFDTSIPHDSLASVRSINLSYNKLKSFTINTEVLPSLEELALNNNEMTSLQSAGTSKLSVKKVTLHNNKLSEIEALGVGCHLESMTDLTANNNEITAISAEMCAGLKSLDVLYLQNNKLSTLPQTLGTLEKLTEIDLYHNKLKVIPPGVLGNLVNLKRLCLDENDLESIPVEIVNLTNLYYLSAKQNPRLRVSPFLASLMSEK